MDYEYSLAELICGAAPEPSQAELQGAARHFADLIGVALAAANEPAVDAVMTLIQSSQPDQPSARIWGTPRRTSMRDAGLVNAFAGHWHDFDDDETDITMAHLTVAAMTAAAVAGDRQRGVAGADVLRAYLGGTELAMVIARMINPAHYVRGWHSTATLGTFAACAAAGILLGLKPSEMRHAIGIAASLASGIRKNFGSATKPLQVGNAVSSGIFAAQAAAAGLGSSEGSLLGANGYIAMQEGDLARVPDIVRQFGQPYGFSAAGMIIKAYPCCTAPHTAIWGVLELAEQHRVDSSEIDRIICHIDPGVFGILIYDWPETPAQAKFSLRYTLAAAALHGRLGVSEFTDAALRHPALPGMMNRVEVVNDTGLPRGPSGISIASRITIILRDGTTMEKFCRWIPGSSDNPLDDDALRRKFVACARSKADGAEAGDLFDLLLSVSTCTDFSALLDVLPQ